MALLLETIWTSDPMKIGKHYWRVGVGLYRLSDVELARCTFHEWRGPHSHVWCDDKHWPTYDDHKSNDGLPITLAKLWAREKETAAEAMEWGVVRGTWKKQRKTELTPAGEQHVIPGCERNASPTAKQLDLFG